MSALPILLAVVASALVFVGGFLIGSRRGRERRVELEASNKALQRDVVSLKARPEPDEGSQVQLQQLQAVVGGLADKMTRQSDEIGSALAGAADALRREVSTLGAQESAREQEIAAELDKLRASVIDRSEFERLLRPLHEDRAESAKLSGSVKDILGPIARTQSIQRTIEALETRGFTRNDLPQLLTEVKERCGLSGCVLADATGLPVSASDGARDVEVIAGLSAFFHTLAARTAAAGQPMPNAFLLRDEEHQLVLARLVTVDAEQYALMAILQGTGVEPGTLDPLVPILRSALTTEPWELGTAEAGR